MVQTINGSVSQTWDPERYARTARFVSDLGTPVLDLLAPEPGDRILDVGCGDGVLTQELAKRCASVVAVDSSPEQIAAAQDRGLDARIMDAAGLTFDAEFDAVFSNAALHWVTDADGAIAGVWRALRPGGRFVGEMGGAGNVAAVARALEAALGRRGVDGSDANPWYFPSPQDYATKLEAVGFGVEHMALFPRPVSIDGDITDWLETFALAFLGAVPTDARATLISEVRDALAADLRNDGGQWTVDYVRLRFAAFKPDR